MKGFFGSSKNYELEHAYDSDREKGADSDSDDISTISGGSKPPSYSKDPTVLVETANEKRLRKRSHWVAYATMFVMTVGFSVVLSGVWPYLQVLDKTLTKQSLGWVVAANPFGQMIASPIVGYIGNRLGSIRVVCYFTMTFFILGNLVYAFLPLMDDWWDHSAYHIMILARFIVGLSSSNVTLCRSYLASSTTTKERTTGIAIISAAQSLGFVVGPAAQTIMSLVIEDEALKYRTAGWFAAILGVFNFALLTPWVFQEYNIAEKEFKTHSISTSTSTPRSVKNDYISAGGMLTSYFFSMMIFIFMETLSVPLVTDQYGWENDLAVVVIGVMTVLSGFLAVFMIVLLRKLLKHFDERNLILTLGYIPIVLGTFAYMPLYTDIQMPISNCTTTNSTQSSFHDFSLSYSGSYVHYHLPYALYHANSFEQQLDVNDLYADCTPGCPSSQEWCEHVSQIPYSQFIVGNCLILLGFPIATALSISLFSKCNKTKPQGLWMAILAEVLSVSRVIGPIAASYMYTASGTIVCFGSLTGGMILGIIAYWSIRHRLPSVNISN